MFLPFSQWYVVTNIPSLLLHFVWVPIIGLLLNTKAYIVSSKMIPTPTPITIKTIFNPFFISPPTIVVYHKK